MTKIAFPLVCIQVDKLYEQIVDMTNDKAVNEQSEFIHDFVESCGWSWDEYLYEWSGLGKLN